MILYQNLYKSIQLVHFLLMALAKLFTTLKFAIYLEIELELVIKQRNFNIPLRHSSTTIDSGNLWLELCWHFCLFRINFFVSKAKIRLRLYKEIEDSKWTEIDFVCIFLVVFLLLYFWLACTTK